jgi:hypothetical protein
MDKGQAHVALILIIISMAVISGILIFVLTMDDPSSLDISLDDLNTPATLNPFGTSTPTTPTPSGTPITRGAMLEGSQIMITESNSIADFVNSKLVTENEAYANYPPVECDLGATPFSQSGASQAVGLRTCNGNDEIADLGATNINAARSSPTFTWVSNPTATVGHVYRIKARDGSEHLIAVTGVGGESVTFIWEIA